MRCLGTKTVQKVNEHNAAAVNACQQSCPYLAVVILVDALQARRNAERPAVSYEYFSYATRACVDTRNRGCQKMDVGFGGVSEIRRPTKAPVADWKSRAPMLYPRPSHKKVISIYRIGLHIGYMDGRVRLKTKKGYKPKHVTLCFYYRILGVADGTRTHDNRNHNPGLYQLSYSHHCLAFCLQCCEDRTRLYKLRSKLANLIVRSDQHFSGCV